MPKEYQVIKPFDGTYIRAECIHLAPQPYEMRVNGELRGGQWEALATPDVIDPTDVVLGKIAVSGDLIKGLHGAQLWIVNSLGEHSLGFFNHMVPKVSKDKTRFALHYQILQLFDDAD